MTDFAEGWLDAEVAAELPAFACTRPAPRRPRDARSRASASGSASWRSG